MSSRSEGWACACEPEGANTAKRSRDLQRLCAEEEEEEEEEKLKPWLVKQRWSWQHEMLPRSVYLPTQRKKRVGTSEGIKCCFLAD